jgi:hypothetical protein
LALKISIMARGSRSLLRLLVSVRPKTPGH